MIIYSIIQKSQLEGAHRLDAEYYQPEYLKWQNLLLRSKPTILKDVATITTGPAYFSEEIREDGEIPLARIGDVVNKIDIEGWLKVSNKEFGKFGAREIKDWDILLSMTGDPPDVGKCNIIDVGNSGTFAFNQRVAKLTSKINPHYLFAFLSTEIARSQMERNALGIRQRNLGINDLRNTLIFIPETVREQEIIGDLIISYLEELKRAKTACSQAENLLLQELGLQNFQADDELFAIINLSEIRNNHRMDAEYFQKKYKDLESRIIEYGARKFLDIIENVPAQFSPKIDETYKYVELAHINSLIGIIDGCNEVIGKEAPSRAKRILKVGDVIVSSVEGSLEKVALVQKEQEGYLASTGFFQLRSKEILPEVLLIFAKSIAMQSQLAKRCSGTILAAVPKESITDILLPILSQPLQQKIAELVRQSHDARKKAKELLEQAKREVEEMIERGGER